MKEIKAYVHRNRIADVIELLDQLDEAEQRHEHQRHQPVALRHGARDVAGKNHARRRHLGNAISTASTAPPISGTSSTPGHTGSLPSSTASVTTASRL